MMQAGGALVRWDAGKKRWLVEIHAGAEVIKRPCPKQPQTADEAQLREMAVATARDEGYDLQTVSVEVVR
jgi:hypothetical protein